MTRPAAHAKALLDAVEALDAHLDAIVLVCKSVTPACPIAPRISWYTDFVRNVTITLDDETARWARIEAAKRDTSVSRLVGELLRRHMLVANDYERARRSYGERTGTRLNREGGAYPGRDELHAR